MITHARGHKKALAKWESRLDHYIELGDHSEHIFGIWLNFGIISGLILVLAIMLKTDINANF